MKTPVQEIFQELAEKHDLCHPNGEINRSAFSRKTGIPAPTVSRIIRGHKDWNITSRIAEALMKSFHISFAQARGDESLSRGSPVGADAMELDHIRDLRALPPEVSDRIMWYARQSVEIYNGIKWKPRLKLVGGRPRNRHI